MESGRKKNPDVNDVGESWGPPQPSYLTYSSLPGTPLPTNLPTQNPSDQDQMQSSYALHQANISQTPYGAADSNSYPYPGATSQPGNRTHFTSSPLVEPRNHWHNRQYSQSGHTSSYTPGDGSDITMGHDSYAYGPPFPNPVLNSQELPVREGWASDEDLVESRRTTITQEIQDQLNRETSSLPLDMPSGPSDYHYRSKESPNDPFSGHHTRQNHRIDEHRLSNIRTNRQNQGPYQQISRKGPGRPTSLTHPAEVAHAHARHGSSGYGEGSSFASEVPGAIAIPQAPMMMDNIRFALPASLCTYYAHANNNNHTIRQSNRPGGQFYPQRDASPFSRSLPSRSPRYDWPTERSVSSAATPAPTEGSADPAQSDQDEYEPRASASSPSTSTSTSASSTASRWARFRVPADVFTNPFDPVRHQMYHQIRHEEWFVNQAQERPITAGEAARIPGSIPGESVLLGFYDRVTDVNGKTVLRCTICMNTNPDAQLYPRPDRAKVHMRHHFELRPIPCSGKCDIPNCMQRFFTMGDLGAHVAGKTEPLATCEYCRKTMRSKNLKRHVANFCHRAPDNLRSKRPA